MTDTPDTSRAAVEQAFRHLLWRVDATPDCDCEDCGRARMLRALLTERENLRDAITGKAEGRISVQGFLKRCEPYLREDFIAAAQEIAGRLDEALDADVYPQD